MLSLQLDPKIPVLGHAWRPTELILIEQSGRAAAAPANKASVERTTSRISIFRSDNWRCRGDPEDH